MKVKISLTLDSEFFNETKEFENCITDVLINYFKSGEILSIEEYGTEESLNEELGLINEVDEDFLLEADRERHFEEREKGGGSK